jgi:putative transposase
LLGEWPLARPADWLAWVNQPQTDAEVEAMRKSIEKGRPYARRPGASGWPRTWACTPAFASAAGRESQRQQVLGNRDRPV